MMESKLFLGLVQCAEDTEEHLAQVVYVMKLLAADGLGDIPSNNALQYHSCNAQL